MSPPLLPRLCCLPTVMSVNTSFSPSNVSLHPSPPFTFETLISALEKCLNTPEGAVSITAFNIFNILVTLPLCVLVLFLGLRRCWQRPSGATMSHSDIFTYNMAMSELMGVFGNVLITCGVYTDLSPMTLVGITLSIYNLFGEMFFHFLTCVERYLAVVYPISYLSLRKEKWIRVRNITTGFLNLPCCILTSLFYVKDPLSIPIYLITILIFFFIAVSFCSLSVVCALIRPAQGKKWGIRQRVGQSKLRAFYTVIAILGALEFRCVGFIVASVLYDFSQSRMSKCCGLLFSTIWFCLPSSLVLPLLFLKRAGKLACCQKSNTFGHGPN